MPHWVAARALTPEIEARREWANWHIARAGDRPPPYGSKRWLALPDGSAVKFASIVCSAEAWRVEDDEPETMFPGAIGYAELFKAAEDREYVERWRSHAREWAYLGDPTPAFLSQQIPPRPIEDIAAEYRDGWGTRR